MTPDLKAFIVALICGSLLMLVWDFFHGLRKAFFHSVRMNILLDTLWWVFCVALTAVCTWHTNNMKLRFFIYFALTGGAFLYYITLSRLIRDCFCVIFNIISKIMRFIFKILLTPAVFLYKILLVPILNRINIFFRKAGSYASVKKQHFAFCKKK